MRVSDYAEYLRWEAQSCPRRRDCPLAFLCASLDGGGRPVLPAIAEVGYEEMSWTDLMPRARVFVVRDGLFSLKVYGNDGTEIPYSIYGSGFLVGLTEIYGPYTASNFFFLSGLVPGTLCGFDADIVEERVSALPGDVGQGLTARALLNQTTSNYGQLLTLAHAKARDRVASVLLRLDTMLSREPGYDGAVPVGHGDIAFIASLKRTTVSRELKALADDGAVRLGYRSVRILPSLRGKYGSLIEANLPFYPALAIP